MLQWLGCHRFLTKSLKVFFEMCVLYFVRDFLSLRFFCKLSFYKGLSKLILLDIITLITVCFWKLSEYLFLDFCIVLFTFAYLLFYKFFIIEDCSHNDQLFSIWSTHSPPPPQTPVSPLSSCPPSPPPPPSNTWHPPSTPLNPTTTPPPQILKPQLAITIAEDNRFPIVWEQFARPQWVMFI